MQSGRLEIEAIAHIRGRSLPRAIFIVDESQQLTKLEIKTIITRISEGGKLVLAGDPDQIDNPYLDAYSNGLVHVLSKMQGQDFFAGITLTKGERSQLAEAGATLL